MGKTQLLILLLLFSIKLFGVPAINASDAQDGAAVVNSVTSSVLSKGRWLKISTSNEGIYKIKFNTLEEWGFSNPEKVTLYGNGGYMLPKMNAASFDTDLTQNAVWQGKDGDNDDCLFFYSTGTVQWTFDRDLKSFTHKTNDYSDEAFYYLSDQGDQKLVANPSDESLVVTDEVSSYAAYQLYEKDLVNLIESGRDWYGDTYQAGRSLNYSFPIANLVSGSSINICVKVAGRASASSAFSITWNGVPISTVGFTGVDTGSKLTEYARAGESRFNVSNSLPTSVLKLTYDSPSSSATGWMDYIELNYNRELNLDDSELMFRNPESVGEGRVSRYHLENISGKIKVWDVTDYSNPEQMDVTVSGSAGSFIAGSSELREFVAFDPTGDIPEPIKVDEIPNQDLHQLVIPEMLIITHNAFKEQAEELALFHEEHDQLSVKVVDVDQIYNEFSSGIADVAGIRNFIRYCYQKSQSDGGDLQSILLFGDGSYDNRNVRENGNNFIPTYQSENSLLPTASFVTDDFFVLLETGEGEANGSMDLAIGRIPAQSTDEAEAVVKKIVSYSSEEALGEWRNSICFIGDDEDSNIHMYQAENLAENVVAKQPAFVVDKIYFDAYEQQTSPSGEKYLGVTEAINSRVRNGTLILNYTGHANETALAEEKVLTIDEIDDWTNNNKLAVFITATCEFSRFDADEQSGGEHILFNPNGGAVALFSTTRIVYSSPNFVLNSQLYQQFFQLDEAGKYLTMGEVVRRTKNAISSDTNKRNFMLLGDPALRLAIPRYSVTTTSLNGLNPDEITEPIGALTKVEVKGEVTDNSGNLMSDFNGQVIPVVYDKPQEVETLGNDGEVPFDYKSRNNPIYKGLASVVNGKFEFSFIVPKDVSYASGNGKIIYYAYNEEIDAHGALSDLPIGEYDETSLADTDGPEIGVYLNTPMFESGDRVGVNSILYLDLTDESGINTLGTGIGHDITAVLDGDYSNVIELNDYYLANLDDFTSGSVVYPFSGLDAGEHTLTLKAWDVFNNSTEITISFVVAEDLMIQDVTCYPNPMNDFTNFKIIHNQPDALLNVQIEFFDSKGSILDVIKQSLVAEGVETPLITWQLSDRQLLVRNGTYFYRVILSNSEGNVVTKGGTLIILRR